MKKWIAGLLILVLLVGIVPAVLASNDQTASTGPKSVKALVIGDQHTRSGFEYLYKILEAEGYTDISLGLLYSKDASLSTYATATTTSATFTFGRNERDFWNSVSGYTVKKAVMDRDWDYIILQTGMSYATDTSSISSAVNTLVPYIRQYNTNAKIGWHMNWGGAGSTAQTTYESAAAATQTAILSNGNIDFVVPAGTAMMNVQTSFMGDAMYKDDATTANALGELIAGYAWYAALTGNQVKELKFDDAFLVYLSSAQRKTIVEAVNNAVKYPCKVTAATYTSAPAQYTATVNGASATYMQGDTVTITTRAQDTGKRAFLNWSAVTGSVTFADATALTTTFKMPAQNVEVKAVYETDANVGTLQVGWGRVDVTPDERNFPEGVTGLNLAGSTDTATRISTGTRTEDDRLYVTAIALSDGEQTNVVMTTDFIRVPTAWADQVQDLCLAKYGLPKDHLSISATHTHSAPDIGDAQGSMQPAKQITSDPESANYWYFEVWRDGIVNAVGQALDDLAAPTQTQIGTVDVPGMNWVRHWRYSTGVMSGTNFESSGGSNKGYARDADREMQMVRFVRPDKQDIVLLNFQAHATSFGGTGGRSYLSADWCGVLVRELEAQDSDCLAAFFQGAAGNLQYVTNAITTEKEKWDWSTLSGDIYEYGGRLANYATTLMENMTTVETNEVKSMRQEHVAVERGYASTRTIQQDVVTVGNSIAFVTAGYEMFDSNGKFVKDNSPYPVTFIIENAQGHEYMPDWQACHYTLLGGPEAYEVRNGCHNEVPGTAEDLANSLVAMLNIVYES